MHHIFKKKCLSYFVAIVACVGVLTFPLGCGGSSDGEEAPPFVETILECESLTSWESEASDYTASINESCESLRITDVDTEDVISLGIDMSSYFGTDIELGWMLEDPGQIGEYGPLEAPLVTDGAVSLALIVQNGLANLYYLNPLIVNSYPSLGSFVTGYLGDGVVSGEGSVTTTMNGRLRYSNFHMEEDPSRLYVGMYISETVPTKRRNTSVTHPIMLSLSGAVEIYMSSIGDSVEDHIEDLVIEFSDNMEIYGCTNVMACNYNPGATLGDGSCEFAQANYDCDGNCTVHVDCEGVCGGAFVEDCEGVCGGDTVYDECGVCGGDGVPSGYCDCMGHVDLGCG